MKSTEHASDVFTSPGMMKAVWFSWVRSQIFLALIKGKGENAMCDLRVFSALHFSHRADPFSNNFAIKILFFFSISNGTATQFNLCAELFYDPKIEVLQLRLSSNVWGDDSQIISMLEYLIEFPETLSSCLAIEIKWCHSWIISLNCHTPKYAGICASRFSSFRQLSNKSIFLFCRNSNVESTTISTTIACESHNKPPGKKNDFNANFFGFLDSQHRHTA